MTIYLYPNTKIITKLSIANMPELINANPTVYIPSKQSYRVTRAEDDNEDVDDVIDSQEVFGNLYVASTDWYYKRTFSSQPRSFHYFQI